MTHKFYFLKLKKIRSKLVTYYPLVAQILPQLEDFDPKTNYKKLFAQILAHVKTQPATIETENISTFNLFLFELYSINPSIDQIHNQNCFRYLLNLQIEHEKTQAENTIPAYTIFTNIIRQWNPELADHLQRIYAQPIYQYPIPYGKFYSQLMHLLEQHIQDIKDAFKTQQLNQQLFIRSIYVNDNHNLPLTYQHIHPLLIEETSRNPGDISKKITRHIDKRGQVNPQTPKDYNNLEHKIRFGVSLFDYTPQCQASMSTVRHYVYHRSTSSRPTELRFGTQGLRVNHRALINPLFQTWLQNEPNDSIQHVYFNLLKYDTAKNPCRWMSFIARTYESQWSHALHQLEEQHPNLAVITLPADQGIMAEHLFKQRQANMTLANCENMFLSILSGKSGLYPQDFHISCKTFNRLFPEPVIERESLEEEPDTQLATSQMMNEDPKSTKSETHPSLNPTPDKSDEHQPKTHDTPNYQSLLNRSFQRVLGTTAAQTELSAAQIQAVWFDFTKFELPSYVLKKLNPQSFNFSCKDAIDRGGIASTYFNLIDSFSTSNPISRREFEQGLHAAATMVKGRGLNHHLNIIWNTIDQLVKTHHHEFAQDPRKSWLIEWRDCHCPKAIRSEFLRERMLEIQDFFETTSKTKELEPMITAIQSFNTPNIPKKHLFLDTLSQSFMLYLRNTYTRAQQKTFMKQSGKSLKTRQQHYETLIKNYRASTRHYHQFCAVLKIFLSTIALIGSLGLSFPQLSQIIKSNYLFITQSAIIFQTITQNMQTFLPTTNPAPSPPQPQHHETASIFTEDVPELTIDAAENELRSPSSIDLRNSPQNSQQWA